MSSVFHAGEIAAQAHAHVRAVGTGIRDYMPDQHRDFFAGLPYLLVATLDATGQPRAQVLSGAPGFVSSPDAGSLRIARAMGEVAVGAPIGLLGLDFSNRRRNRANGVVRGVSADGIDVSVRESFGNCPQHITVRKLSSAVSLHTGQARSFTGLAERDLITRADTFFIATSGGEHGVDISHRGGPPGFVIIEGNTLTVPDYNGNRYFNTLGNLLLDKRAALLFIDFDSGDVLELQGAADIVWGEDGAVPGRSGGRAWRFEVARGSLHPGQFGLRQDEKNASPKAGM